VTEPQLPEKRVTWAELFFDLVFVVAITEVSALLHEDHGWLGVARALVVFVPIYWAWVGTSVHANTHDVNTAIDRIGIFAIGLCGLFMALAVPGAYAERGWLYGAGYLALRIVLAALVFRGPRLSVNPFSVAVFISGPLMLLGGLLPDPVRLWLWALAALLDLATPAVARRRLAGLRFHPVHLPERFGLFVIVALGESIVAIGVPAASARTLTPGTVGAVAAAFVLSCALWWVYFAFAADAMRHALTITEVQTDVVRRVLSYGHLGFIAAIIAMAVGFAEVVAHPGEHLHLGTAGLLFGGCALYLGMFGYTRWHMFRTWSTTRLGAAALVLVSLPAALPLPGIAALAVLAVLVIGLNVLEHLLVRRRARVETHATSTLITD
jgi:low temperature requirement protein LtrA